MNAPNLGRGRAHRSFANQPNSDTSFSKSSNNSSFKMAVGILKRANNYRPSRNLDMLSVGKVLPVGLGSVTRLCVGVYRRCVLVSEAKDSTGWVREMMQNAIMVD